MSKHYLFVRILYKVGGALDNKFHLGNIGRIINNCRHRLVLYDIRKYLTSSLNYTKLQVNNESFKFNKVIWLFWWQGYYSMPYIVRKCINSIQDNSNNAKIIFLDKYNVKKYSTLPKYIYDKTIRGNISFTEFSDILRYNLLYNYGGLWLDPTNYCTSDIDINYFSSNHILITSGCPDKYHFFICNKWAESLVGGYKNNLLFLFMNKFFELYWKNNASLINYNLVDYALYFAYRNNIGNFAYYVNNKSPKNNPNMFKLMPCINKKYNSKTYNKFIKNTHIFKLTYKSKFINNSNTFYNVLMK